MSSSTQTGTPSSTGVPALPFEIHRVWVSKIENTFSSLRDRLALEKTAFHMVDLPHGMPEIVLDVHEFPRCRTMQGQIRERRLHALHKITAALEIRLDPLRTGPAMAFG